MTQEEIKKFIAEKVDEDLSLSQIQDLLTEKGVKMTFMDLRLIASEIESGVWKKHEAEDPVSAPAAGQKNVSGTGSASSAGRPEELEEDFPEECPET